MRTPALFTLLVAIALVLVPCGGNAQVIFVETFEAPATSNYITFAAGQQIVTATNTWTVTANSVDLYAAAARPEAAAFDGAQAVDLTGSPGEGVMETVMNTTPGAEYELVFHYARNAYIDPDTACAQVDVIGSATLLHDTVQHIPSLYSFSTYLEYQNTFVADSTETILRFTGLDPNVAGVTIDGISVTLVTPSGTADDRTPVAGDAILAVRPNPFNPIVAIDYVTADAGFVQADVFDARGRFIAALIREHQVAGPHTATWTGTGQDGRVAASGIYFVVLTTPEGTSKRKLVLLK